ncbi:MAG TPA: hypothetical protein VHC44_07830 [Verrucomicrobiae bacterium]|nr:hypothetical protein [Verrucomicrobiae bacterium]
MSLEIVTITGSVLGAVAAAASALTALFFKSKSRISLENKRIELTIMGNDEKKTIYDENSFSPEALAQLQKLLSQSNQTAEKQPQKSSENKLDG